MTLFIKDSWPRRKSSMSLTWQSNRNQRDRAHPQWISVLRIWVNLRLKWQGKPSMRKKILNFNSSQPAINKAHQSSQQLEIVSHLQICSIYREFQHKCRPERKVFHLDLGRAVIINASLVQETMMSQISITSSHPHRQESETRNEH